MKRNNIGYAYIAIWIIGFLLLTIYPFISSLFISFTNYDMINSPEFVGLENFKNLFSDQEFLDSLIATFKYTFFTVPLQLAFSLFVAFILNFKLKGISFYRTAYYVPSLLGGNVAIAILWRFMFEPDGFINRFLQTFGLEPVKWFSTSTGAMTVIVLLKIWQFGSSMLIFLAALKEVPTELYEAADVDGASRWRQFFTITIPLITPTIFFNLIMQLVNAFQEFNGPYLVTGRGPLNSTYLTSMFIYDNAFKYFKMGYSSAASWILFIIIVIFTLILFGTQKKWVYYSDGGGK